MSIFVVFEGIDGSGKSTISEAIKSEFHDIYLTREPTDSTVGTLAQKIAKENTDPYKDLFLYLADRVEHTKKIKEKLKKENLVICDRYWGSTAAYQAATDKISLEYAESIQEPFILKPDLTILFDIKPKESLRRINPRGEKSKYENIDFLKKVRENYLLLAEKHDWEVIDAEKGFEDVLSKVKILIKNEKGDIE